VAKKCVIVAAPFDNKLTAIAENNVNGFYKSLMEKDYIWLKEHIENGLPKQEGLENLLKQNNLSYKKTGHTNIFIWEKLIKYNILRDECGNLFDQENSDEEDLNKYYNKNLFTKDFNVLPYRYFYFINLGNEEFGDKDYIFAQADLVENIISNFVVFSDNVLNKLIEKIITNTKNILFDRLKLKENQIQNLLNSTSWKITKPLRWLMDKLKNIKMI
ncbi:MAG: hypothetical protein JXA16_09270, partial [Bacteroidales bacterium]|nr:hypothetical protein [Bacteroidales bacterium]